MGEYKPCKDVRLRDGKKGILMASVDSSTVGLFKISVPSSDNTVINNLVMGGKGISRLDVEFIGNSQKERSG